jgi:hypothetical protein
MRGGGPHRTLIHYPPPAFERVVELILALFCSSAYSSAAETSLPPFFFKIMETWCLTHRPFLSFFFLPLSLYLMMFLL